MQPRHMFAISDSNSSYVNACEGTLATVMSHVDPACQDNQGLSWQKILDEASW